MRIYPYAARIGWMEGDGGLTAFHPTRWQPPGEMLAGRA